MRWSRSGTVGAVCSALALLGACAPVHDWRDVRVANGVLRALLPCKPATQVRKVNLAGQPVSLSLLACNAGGQTWALAWTDVQDPRQVGPALRDLRAAAVANVGAATTVALPLQVPGATPHADSVRVGLQGQRPDGRPVREQVAMFVFGTVVAQATVLGEELPEEAVETFFAALRAGP